MGSSPRMRGTHALALAEGARTGIIPAHAGNTASLPSCPWCRGDHPRACGEHYVDSAINPVYAGSSPRMRGTRFERGVDGVHGGIIPAHAGNTRITANRVTCVRDHPRACGEHIYANNVTQQNRGSSPRMRGTPAAGVAVVLWGGIIPAHAGNTC